MKMTSHTMRKLTCMVCLALVGMSAVQATSDVYSRRLLQVSDGQYKQGEDVCIPGAATESVLDRISNDPQFSTLNTIIEKFGLGSILSDTSNKVTLFAPTDSAWSAAFADNVENTALTYSKLKSLLNEFSNDANGQQLMSEIIKYHVLPKVVAFDDLKNQESLTTLWDQDTLVVNQEPGDDVTSNYTELAGDLSGAVITRADIWLCNGVVHIIDTVLLPQAAEDTFNKDDENNRRKLNLLGPFGYNPKPGNNGRKLNQAGDTNADDEALESSITQFMNTASKFLDQFSDSDDTDSDKRRKLLRDDLKWQLETGELMNPFVQLQAKADEISQITG